MQNTQFNNLMNFDKAKWIDLANQEQDLINLLKNPTISIEEKRQEIEKKEVEIPSNIRADIDKFMKHHKDLGTKNRTIRRMVKRKWNIEVI